MRRRRAIYLAHYDAATDSVSFEDGGRDVALVHLKPAEARATGAEAVRVAIWCDRILDLSSGATRALAALLRLA